jgi:ParB family chromosome partitioning protein
MHKAQTYLDDAVRYRELLEEGVVPDQGTLAREFSLTDAAVSKLLSIGELPFVALEYMAANVQAFPPSISYLLYQYWNRNREDAEPLMSLMHDVVDHKMSVRQVEAVLREDAEGSRKRRERPLSQTVFKGEFSGSLKYYNSRLTLELGDLKGPRGERLYSQISEVIQKHATAAAQSLTPQEGPPA